MANSLLSTRSERRDFIALASLVYQYVARLAVLTRVKAKSVLRALQTARIMSVLANMSDQQLARIGISRSDIPQYAEGLMSKE